MILYALIYYKLKIARRKKGNERKVTLIHDHEFEYIEVHRNLF